MARIYATRAGKKKRLGVSQPFSESAVARGMQCHAERLNHEVLLLGTRIALLDNERYRATRRDP